MMGPFKPVAAAEFTAMLRKVVGNTTATLHSCNELPSTSEVLVEESKLAAFRLLADWGGQ